MTDADASGLRRAFEWFFRNRHTGAITIAQFPNLPLWLFLAASVLRRVAQPRGAAGTAVSVGATAALAWWAVDEVLRGVNPFRRLLGGVVLAFTIVRLFD